MRANDGRIRNQKLVGTDERTSVVLPFMDADFAHWLLAQGKTCAKVQLR